MYQGKKVNPVKLLKAVEDEVENKTISENGLNDDQQLGLFSEIVLDIYLKELNNDGKETERT